jgi:hypothetical protein
MMVRSFNWEGGGLPYDTDFVLVENWIHKWVDLDLRPGEDSYFSMKLMKGTKKPGAGGDGAVIKDQQRYEKDGHFCVYQIAVAVMVMSIVEQLEPPPVIGDLPGGDGWIVGAPPPTIKDITIGGLKLAPRDAGTNSATAKQLEGVFLYVYGYRNQDGKVKEGLHLKGSRAEHLFIGRGQAPIGPRPPRGGIQL